MHIVSSSSSQESKQRGGKCHCMTRCSMSTTILKNTENLQTELIQASSPVYGANTGVFSQMLAYPSILLYMIYIYDSTVLSDKKQVGKELVPDPGEQFVKEPERQRKILNFFFFPPSINHSVFCVSEEVKAVVNVDIAHYGDLQGRLAQ